MKKFVEKLIERLEELKEDVINEECPVVPNSEDCEMEYSCASCYLNAAIKIVKEQAEEFEMGDISDGCHTFNELYHHRAVLFAVICNSYRELAWKSKLHDTGDMYDGMFIVGIETHEGQATYHYDINPYWDIFKVKELPNAPRWDGHTPDEAIRRILLFGNNQGWIPVAERLPMPENEVLIMANRKYAGCKEISIITIAMYEDGTIRESDSIWCWEDIDGEFDEEENCYIIPKGWWESRQYNPDDVYNNAIDDEVIAWMPLPEAYKPEEQKKIPTDHYEERFRKMEEERK